MIKSCQWGCNINWRASIASKKLVGVIVCDLFSGADKHITCMGRVKCQPPQTRKGARILMGRY